MKNSLVKGIGKVMIIMAALLILSYFTISQNVSGEISERNGMNYSIVNKPIYELYEPVHIEIMGLEGLDTIVRVSYEDGSFQYAGREIEFVPSVMGDYNVTALLSYEDEEGITGFILRSSFSVKERRNISLSLADDTEEKEITLIEYNGSEEKLCHKYEINDTKLFLGTQFNLNIDKDSYLVNELVHVSTSGPEEYNSLIRVNYGSKFVEYNQTELDFMPESIGNYNVVALLSYEDDCNSLSKFLTARFKVSDIKLEEEKKDIIDIVDLSVETNKEIYFQDEAVYMMLPSNVSRLKVIHKEAIFSYLDIIENISFRPPYPGDYKIEATVYMNGLPHILVTNFSVVDTAVSEVEMEELSLVNLTEISEWLIIETDKEKYDLGDAVQIISNANIIELKLRHKEGIFGYLGEFTRNITFRPQYIGDYIIEVKTVENGLVKTLTAEFYVDNVSVDDISLAYLPKPKPEKKELRFIIKNSKNEKLNSVIRILDKRNKSVRDKGGKKAIGMASVDDTMEMMEYDLEVIPEEQPIRKILFKNLEASENESLELRFEEVEKDKVNVPVKNVRNSFAIDPSKLKFSEAEITVIAKGTELYKCKDWNFSEQRCYGSWEKIMDLVPGKEYHINITADDPAFAEIGLIAINTHKSIYLPDETAFIGIGILDHEGHVVCDADVTLVITDSSGVITQLTTMDGDILVSDECESLGVTDLPDYYTYYNVSGVGNYIMNVSAVTYDGVPYMIDNFSVQSSVEFDVSRNGPTRIYPYVPYIMNITIKANKNYDGEIIERVPKGFVITSQDGLIVTENDDDKILTWDKNLAAGQEYNIYYEFDAPDVSPEFYILGKLNIDSWEEARYWQIASDTELATYWFEDCQAIADWTLEPAAGWAAGGTCVSAGASVDNMTRGVDLSNTETANLTFDWSAVRIDSDEYLKVFASSDGNLTFTEIFSYTGNGGNSQGGLTERINLDSYLTKDASIRFYCISGGGESCTVDNINVSRVADNDPSVSLDYPSDNANLSSATIDFNCTISEDNTVINVSLYGNWSGAWIINETNISGANNEDYIFTKVIPDGNFIWNCEACDDAGQCAFFASNYSFTVDTANTTITLNYPGAGTVITSSSVNFNWTVTDNLDTTPLCNLTVDSVVKASSQASPNGTPVNYTVTGLTSGAHTWNVTCWDDVNNINTSDTRSFTVDVKPAVSFESPTPDDNSNTTNTSVEINVSINTGVYLGEMKFNWNGTNISFYEDDLVGMLTFEDILNHDDNFTTEIDSDKWDKSADASWSNGMAFIQHPSSGAQQGFESKFQIHGDFDIKATFSNLNLPANFCAIGMEVLGSGTASWRIERRRQDINYIATDFNGFTSEADSSTEGTFRIRRVNGTGYVYKSDGVTVFKSAAVGNNSVTLEFYGRDDSVASSGYIDNVTITAGNVIIGEKGKYNATMHGDIDVISDGKYGNAVLLDGSNDYLSLRNISNMSGKNFSLGIWFKKTDADTDSNRIISKGGSNIGTPANTGYYIRTIGNKMEFFVSDGTNSYTVNTTEPSINSWHHVFGVVDRENSKLRLYLDGHQVNDTALGTLNSAYTNVILSIGAYDKDRFGETIEYFAGYVDEFRVWNKTVTAAEVKAYYYGNLEKLDSENWLLYLNQTNLTNTTYTYYAYARDMGGGENSTEIRTLNVIRDNKAPSISVESPESSYTTGATSVSFSWTATDNDDLSLYCNLTIDGKANESDISVSSASSHTTTVSGFNPGSYSWNVSCWDGWDNVNTSASRSFVIAPTPYLYFMNKTPDNNTKTVNTAMWINVSIAEPSLNDVILNWNGTNISFYEDDLVGMLTFEDILDHDDNFTTQIDPDKWDISPAASWSGGMVFIDHAVSAAREGIESKFRIHGDFDVRADYSNLNLPSSGTFCAIGMDIFGTGSAGNLNVERRFQSVSNQRLATDFDTFTYETDSSTEGTFRIRRVNGTVYIYSSDGSTIFKNASVGNNSITIEFYGRDSGDACDGYIDNVTITAGNVVIGEKGKYNATMHGDIDIISDGRYGNAVLLDGSYDYLSLRNISNMSGKNFSLGIWFKKTDADTDSNRIISKGGSNIGTPANTGYYIRTIGNKLEFFVSDGTNSYTVNTTEPSINVWHHIFGVVDRENSKLRLYLDGYHVNDTTLGTLNSVYTNVILSIGAYDKDRFGETIEYFAGYVDEFRVWNRTVTAAEVKAYYYGNLEKLDNESWLLYLNQTNLTEGTYNYYAYAKDTSNNENMTEVRTITVDYTAPEVLSVNATPQKALNGTTINITADVSDANGISSIKAVLYYPNGTNLQNLTMAYGGGDIYWNASYEINFMIAGTYNITIWANDSIGNINNSEKTWFTPYLNLSDSQDITINGSFEDWSSVKNVSDVVGDGYLLIILENATLFKNISTGYYHSCGLALNGSAYCWGMGSAGRLGYGGIDNRNSPIAVNTSGRGNFTSISVGSGSAHTCGILTNGSAYCWGSGSKGRLGYGGIDNRNSPIAVNRTGLTGNFTMISASYEHTCAILSNGSTYCWGEAWDGRLGYGGTDDMYSPVPVNMSGIGDNFTYISAGWQHTCGLVSNGSAYCWGNEYDGRLGNGVSTSTTENSPVLVSLNANFTIISAGDAHTCGILTNGYAYCWGDNGKGQLGDGSFGDSSTPVLVNMSGLDNNFTTISAGDEHSCGILTNGSAYCWGEGGYGRRGDGTKADLGSPVPINISDMGSGGGNFTAIFAGNIHSCGILTNGSAYCWGYGGQGNLGYGGTDDLYSPIPVNTTDSSEVNKFDLKTISLANNNSHLFALISMNDTLDFSVLNRYYRIFISTNGSTGNDTTPDTIDNLPINYNYRIQVNGSECLVYNHTDYINNKTGCSFDNNSYTIELSVLLSTLNITTGDSINVSFETGSSSMRYDIAPDYKSFLSYDIVAAGGVDSDGPTISLDAPANATWQKGQFVSFNYTATDALSELDTCILYGDFNGTWLANLTNSTAVSGVQYSFELNLTNGTYIWNVWCNDTLGNSAFNSTNYTLHIDSAEPSITLNSPADNNLTSNTYIDFNWTVTDNLDTNLTCNLTIADKVNVSDIESLNGTAINQTVRNFAEGTYYWNVTCWDNANNTNTSLTRNFTIDTTAPKISLDAPANNTWQKEQFVSFNYTATDALSDLDTCILYGDFNGTWLANLTNNTATSGVSYSFELNLTNGTYIWNVWCNDTLGNSASNSTNYTLHIDSIQPSITLNSPADNNLTSNTYIDFNWTAIDNLDTNLTCNLTIADKVNVSDIESLNGTAVNQTVRNFADGTYYWNVTCWDNANNTNTSLTRNFTIDTTAPKISLDSPANNTWQKEQFVSFNYTATDALSDLDTCILYGDFNGTWLANLTNSTAVSGVQYSFELNLTNGTYIWNVWCNDTLGNSAFNSTNYTLHIDSIEPSITLNSPADNNATIDTFINFNWTVADTVDTNLTCNLTIADKVNVSDIESLNGTATNYTVRNFAEGTYYWNVTCWDNANNTNTSLTRNFTISSVSNIIINILDTNFTNLIPGTTLNNITNSLNIKNTGSAKPGSGINVTFMTNVGSSYGLVNDTFVINASNFRLNNTQINSSGITVYVAAADDLPAGTDVNWSASLDVPNGQVSKVYKGTILISWIV